jgi:hypothetical protein
VVLLVVGVVEVVDVDVAAARRPAAVGVFVTWSPTAPTAWSATNTAITVAANHVSPSTSRLDTEPVWRALG